MIVDNILDILKNILDVLLVWFMFYYILKNIKNNVKMSLLFKGVLVVIILKLLSSWLGLNTLGLIIFYKIFKNNWSSHRITYNLKSLFI